MSGAPVLHLTANSSTPHYKLPDTCECTLPINRVPECNFPRLPLTIRRYLPQTAVTPLQDHRAKRI